MGHALDLVKQELTDGSHRDEARASNYTVPGLWSGTGAPHQQHRLNPYRFYLDRIRWIEGQPEQPLVSGGPHGEWTKKAVIYNTLIRAATGWDHNGDDEINLDPIGGGWMETGTFLKTIAVLPLVKRMGFNTLHLLPVTAIGEDGHKGTLGSVYAVRNPYRLDPRLAEPVLGLKPEDQFAALIEAAHHLGLRVVLEFVFRTASRDADWVADHPEWFYWIRDDIPDREPGQQDASAYGAPVFPDEQLKRIKRRVESGGRDDLIPPPETYRHMFTAPPRPDRIERIGRSWIGTLEDGTRVRIPGAFADWPPDDPQPPWTDVTYLRLYDHPDFNYIAYNTVRMYDARLARPENRVEDLWDRIVGILPYYQRRFGIDGVMIDMGHALPIPLKRRTVTTAREIDADFAFWDENFSITRQSREEGYNAVIGNYWWLAYRPQKLVQDMLRRCAGSGYPIPFFTAPESHNTPRAAARPGGDPYARLLWALGCLLPAVPFCHAGFELAEMWPVNTGLDFEQEQLSRYRADDLPLFSQAAYDWDKQPNLVDWIRRVLDVRARYADVVTDPDPFTFDLLESNNPHVWAVVRRRRRQAIGVVFNLSWDSPQTFSLRVPTGAHHLTDLLTGSELAPARGTLQSKLDPAESLIFGW
ncbi:MAG: alpha-glucosidase C-terminal domain-containing protein [Chloroflexota bacterium]